MTTKTTKDLLALIAKYEGGHWGYLAVYGSYNLNLTSMSLNQVLSFQKSIKGPSTAVGAYQFIRPTLLDIKKNLGLKGTELFDEGFQDSLGKYLLKRRGLKKYLAGELPRATFLKNLSKEWASLPKDKSGLSYYHGDGLNKAHCSFEELDTLLKDMI